MPWALAAIVGLAAVGLAGSTGDASSLLQHTFISIPEATLLEQGEVGKLRAAAARLVAQGKRNAVLATFSADFLSLANNFACSWLASAGDDAGLVLVALDGHCQGLSGSFAGADVDCVAVQPKATPPLEADHVKFKSPRYFFMTRLKLAVFSVWLDLVAAHETFKWVLLSDVDVVIHHEPFHYINEYHQERHQSRRSLPILCAPNTPSCPPSRNNSKINSGFCFYRAGLEASRLLRTALAILVAGNSSDGADQGAIRKAIREETGHDSMATDTMLPCKRFPIGRFFRNPSAYEDPMAIHANYLATDQKEPCFRASGRWFVADGPGAACRPPAPPDLGSVCT